MNLAEALEWAADYTKRTGIFDPVTNARGYADGWKPPTPAEKAKIIKDLAMEVADVERIPKALARSYLISAIGSVDDVTIIGKAMMNLDALLEGGE